MSLNFIIKRGSLRWNKISWKRFEKATFLTQNQLNAVKKWNNELGVSYFKFRAELKSIAYDCLGSVKDAHVVDYSYIDLLTKLPRQAIIVMADDDDLLSPTIFEELRECRTNRTLLFIWDPGKWEWAYGYFGIVKKSDIMTINSAFSGLRKSPLCDVANKMAELKRNQHGMPIYNKPKYLVDGYEVFLVSDGVEHIRKIITNSPSLTRAPSGISLAVKSPASATRIEKFNLKNCSEFGMPTKEHIPTELRWCDEYAERYASLAKRTFGTL